MAKIDRRWSSELGEYPPKKVRIANPRYADHFGDRWQLAVARLVITPELKTSNVINFTLKVITKMDNLIHRAMPLKDLVVQLTPADEVFFATSLQRCFHQSVRTSMNILVH